jgi:tetratricopeptide (TPR) repeat protein
MTKKRFLLTGSSVLISLAFVSCVAMAVYHSKALFLQDEKTITVGRTYEKVMNYRYEFADFEPIVTKVEKLPLKPTKDDGTSEYSAKMNNAISLLRTEKYKEAIEALDTMSREYKDDGLALYNLGVCYIKTKEYDSAIKFFANSYAAGFHEAFGAIDDVHSLIAYNCFQEKNYPDAIRYYKTVPADTNISMNVIYCYMAIAKTFPYPKSLIPLLYAGNYIVDNGVVDKNILALGGEIGRQLGDAPAETYLPNAIAVLEYLVKATDNPWTRINLGMLYAHAGQPEPARGQFEAASQRAGNDKDAFRFASGRMVEMEQTQYRYRKEVPFTVAVKDGNIGKASLEATFSLPQNGFGQTVSGLEVLLNGKPVPFKVVKDRYQAEVVSVNLNGFFAPGDNTFTVQALVGKSARRFEPKILAAFTPASYDKRHPSYKLYTESTKIYNLAHPLVKKGMADIRGKLKKSDVGSIVRAVYDYVIDRMKYELYDNSNRPKEEILDRLQKTDGVGLCEDYAVFTASLLRAFGIPSLVLAGPTFNSDIGHAWPALFTPAYDQAIVVDTTWGDTGQMPNYYFLFNTNQNVVENVAWDSDMLPKAQSLTYRHSSNNEVVFKKETDAINRWKK